MHRKLLIKHVTGRLLLDSDKAGCPFALTPHGERWLIRVSAVDEPTSRAIGAVIDELNLFYFETDDDGTLRKWWLYGKAAAPDLRIDEATGELLLELDSRVAYTNRSVSGT